MKVIFDSTVEVVGRQVVDYEHLQDFLEEHGANVWHTDSLVGANVLAEVAGRTCYMSFAKPRPGGNQGYLDHIKEVGHGSVLEHACWNFILHGVSRSLTHELVRHRAGWAYSQLSQRYVDESVCEVVVPPELRKEVELAQEYLKRNKLDMTEAFRMFEQGEVVEPDDRVRAGVMWLVQMRTSNTTYVRLSDYLTRRMETAAYKEYLEKTKEVTNLPKFSFEAFVKARGPEQRTTDRKAARGAARSVLPNATETKVFCTANARALRHFFEMRASPAADAEIRKVAFGLWVILQAESPALFGDYVPLPQPDGTTALQTSFRKV